MATITHPAAAELFSSADASSYASNAFTPAAGDLLVVWVSASAHVGDTGTLVGSASLTFTKFLTALYNSSNSTLYGYVADQLATAVSQTVTFDCSADAATGCIILVERISGIARTGASAVLQSAKQENGTASTTPAPVFGASCQTGNPTLGAVTGASNPMAMTPPTSWTEFVDGGHGSPTRGMESIGRNSGFTGTTVTWGSATPAVTWASAVVEIDTSSGAYALTADLGTFTLAGQDAGVAVAHMLASDLGTFTADGQAATLRTDRLLTGDLGTFTLAGQDATTRATRMLAADVGTFTLGGQASTLRSSRALLSEVGAHALTGQDATLSYAGGSPVEGGAIDFGGGFQSLSGGMS